MQKTTKGAFAAAAAATLLLGGAGSLAYWTTTGTVDGSSISSGHLKLASPSCAGWKLDDGTALASGDKIVPGEVLTQVCTYKVDAVGKHLTATFDVTGPTWAAATGLSAQLQPEATYEVNGVPVTPPAVPVANNDVVKATVTVTFDGATATNTSEDLGATLNNITITATQAHSAA